MEVGNSVKIDQFNRIQGATLILGEKHYPVFKGINCIGRNKLAIINIKHLNVSQNQAIIVIVDENQHFISDLNSSNGTFIHNAKLVPFKLYELTNEVDIKFGDVEARYKVEDHNTTVRLQETLGMSETQNITQNFYASNTQLVINTSTSNQSDQHNYSNISQQKSDQPNITEDIHDMATQVERYPEQSTVKVTFAKPFVKSIVRSVEESISDIHNAPTQVINLTDHSSDSKLISRNSPENIEEDIEATQVMNYPDKYDVSKLTGRTHSPIQNVSNGPEENISSIIQKSVESYSSEATSAGTEIINSEETSKIVDQMNTTLHYKQKSVIHNSQIPSISGLNITKHCEQEDSFINHTKAMEIEGVIDETILQPNDENSNDSVDFFTMQNMDEEHIDSIKVSEDILKDNTLEQTPCETDGYQLKQSVQNLINKESIPGSDIQLASKVLSFDSGSETDIEDSEEDIPRGEEMKNTGSNDDNIHDICTKENNLKNLDHDNDIDNTQDICMKKKPLRKLDSDDTTDTSEDICIKKKPLKKLDSGDNTDTSQDICVKKKPLKKLDSEDDYIDSTQEICMKKKPSRKLDSDDSDNDTNSFPSKKKKIESENVTTLTNNVKDYVSESETDCEDECPAKTVESSDNIKNRAETNGANDDSDTKNEDNDQPAENKNDHELSLQQNDLSKLEKSSLNDTDCIPATQDAFAEAFSYHSSKTQINENQSSEEESFKLGITQLMEDSTENKTEEFRDNKKSSNDDYISTKIDNDNQQLKQYHGSEVANSDDIFLEPTQRVNIVTEDEQSMKNTVENPSSPKNDDFYFMPTQKISSEKDIQSNFKIPSKKFTFKKRTANLEESLSKILSNDLSNDIEDDVYMVATQQIDVSVPQKENNVSGTFEQATQKLNVENDDDVFLQTTQCLSVDSKKHPEGSRDDDVYFLPTQQISVEEDDAKADGDGKNDQDEEYMLETQILPEREKKGSKETKESAGAFHGQTSMDSAVILNDMNMYSHDTQSEMLFSDENVQIFPPPDNFRPENPVIHVLNEESKIEENNSRPENPVIHVVNEETEIEENNIRPETLVIHELTVIPVLNEETEIEENNFRPEKPVIHELNEDSEIEENNSRPENTVIHVLNEESKIEEINKADSGILRHSSPLKINVSSPSRSKFTRKCDIKSLQDKIKADIKNDDAETLSQIETFIKKPVENVSEKPEKIIGEEETLSQIEAFVKKPLDNMSKKNIEKEEVETLSQIEAFIKKPLDVNDSRVRRSVRKNQTISEETIRTDDVNQSFALLETKTSKVKRQPKRDIIDEIKVTVTSHRRSMSVAESSIKEALDESCLVKKSRKVTVNNNVESRSTRGKRKPEKAKDREPEVPSKVSRSNCVSEKSSTDLAPRKSSHTLKKNRNFTTATVSEETSTSSDSCENDLDNRKNKTVTVDGDMSSSVDNTNAISVSSITLHKRGKSTLKNNENVGNILGKSEASKSAMNSSKNSKRIVGMEKSKIQERIETTEPSTPSKRKTNSKFKVESDESVSTPERNNRSNSDDTLLSSAERSRRKQRPKVVFTMLDNPQLELYIKHLGGRVVDGVDACTVLVTGEVKRSQKLLEAVAQGKPICSPSWIQASKKSNEFLDPWDFILIDKEAESKWNFSLRESLNRANCKKLLSNYSFQLMVSKAVDVLKGAIEAGGGKCVTRNPGKNYDGHFVVVASPEYKAKLTKLKNQNPNITIVEPEAIFDGVLRQELRFKKHLIA